MNMQASSQTNEEEVQQYRTARACVLVQKCRPGVLSETYKIDLCLESQTRTLFSYDVRNLSGSPVHAANAPPIRPGFGS